MSKSSMRIVLVDPLGDVLFSGQSMIAREQEDDEPFPATQRSPTSDSGIYAIVRPHDQGTPDNAD